MSSRYGRGRPPRGDRLYHDKRAQHQEDRQSSLDDRASRRGGRDSSRGNRFADSIFTTPIYYIVDNMMLRTSIYDTCIQFYNFYFYLFFIIQVIGVSLKYL